MNLASIIEGHPSDAVALIEDQTAVTYGELETLAGAMRAHLRSAGIVRGDRVALAAGNGIGFVVATLGVLGIGAQLAPFNPYSPTPELRTKVELLRPKAVLVGEVAAPLLDDPGDPLGVPLIDIRAMLSPPINADAPPIVELDQDDIAVLLSTSGVSGVPKVAMLSHHNLAWIHQGIVGDGPQQIGPNDVSLGVLPFAHVLGLNVVLFATLRAGGCVVLQGRFDVDASLDLIREHEITMVVGAPPMWQRWATSQDAPRALTSVRFARSGAASLPADVYERVRDYCGIEVLQGYGLTESASVVSTGRGHDVRVTSVGKPLPGVELVLVNDAGDPVDLGDIGEVVVRSPGVFKGYFEDADATASVLTDDGWLWTGDVGLFDDDGFLYLVDRVKDIIIVSGFNVYPAEVEDALMRHPDVRGAVVVGEAHGETGETVVAHVSGAVDQESLRTFMQGQLSRYKQPTRYEFVAELPSTPVGKRVRRELRQ